MTNNEHPAEQTLRFDGHPIRIAMLDGVPWFSLSDILAALNRNPCFAAPVFGRRFPEYARRSCWETEDNGSLVEATLLNPVGVYLFTALTDPYVGQKIAAWSRRETNRLCPDPRPNDPAVFLTLMPDGQLPPKPLKYSGRKSEWLDLREAILFPPRPSSTPAVTPSINTGLPA